MPSQPTHANIYRYTHTTDATSQPFQYLPSPPKTPSHQHQHPSNQSSPTPPSEIIEAISSTPSSLLASNIPANLHSSEGGRRGEGAGGSQFSGGELGGAPDSHVYRPSCTDTRAAERMEGREEREGRKRRGSRMEAVSPDEIHCATCV